ncbi:dihydrofolate reductase family protein [Streptomyces hoynatensis]|uniref:Dihydrofolate reductase n=1 Tax=Streptomyces hoynatensis TaxID=1141874 RepID=A0A3A9YPN8_9ACTN|nr:dihydrofolate reductase family protein [Streptomyces hoynatensis]RKN37166.1 dihydrofolate reductase [Streptomyces hoynatensis]
MSPRREASKVVVSMSVSLDGFFEGRDGDISWHRVDEELHRHFNEELAAASAFLEGRVTHELMAAYWPTADADPANAGAVAEFAAIWREKPKIVFSRSLRQAKWNARVAHAVDAAEIRALKERSAGDLSLGGANLAAEFARQDLIDEYRLYVNPVLLGAGRRLFPEGQAPRSLVPAGTRTFGNGVVLLRYLRGER